MDDTSFIDIDVNALDREWLEQPRLFLKYALQLSAAKARQREAEADLDLVEADLDLAIRDEPAMYELPKVTEAAVKLCILRQDRYVQAAKKERRAQHEVDDLQAAVNALDHRKRALENEVQLWGWSYFAAPAAPAAARDGARELDKQAVRRKGRATRDER